MEYSSGISIEGAEHKWSFVGYKKQSKNKDYDGGTAKKFYFSKSLLCFQECLPGVCDSEKWDLRSPDAKCCVEKELHMGESVDGASCNIEWAKQHAKPVPLEELTRADGIKVF